jgi:HNH endonuclease
MDITPERLLAFRKTLREEMLGPQLWYHKTKDANKDIMVVHPECPYAQKNTGKIAEHRYIWWLNHKSDPIGYNEMIHHINGDHQDNRIENLEKVKMKQHGLRHKELRDVSTSAIRKCE